MKGYFRKRGDKWSYTVDAGRDPVTGRRKQKTKSGFKTKKEAEKALNELIYELNKGTYFEPSNLTFGEYALEWFENHEHRLRDTTAVQYKSKIDNHIIPTLGAYKLIDLKPIHGQMFVKELISKMKHNTAHKIFSITNYILKGAVNLELIPKNPFENVTRPKDAKKDIKVWEFQELKKFLEVVRIDKDNKEDNLFYYRIFTVAAYTGMRKGEILGLRKRDVDFDNKVLNINKSIAETKEKGVQISDLKTPSSYRQVAIDDFLCSILKEQLIKNNENKLRLGEMYERNDLIFCREDGKPFRPTNINRPFKRYINAAGVSKIRFHDLRHTHATLLMQLGTNPKIVSERLGHANIKITLDTYSHVTSEMQINIMRNFSEKLKQTK